MEKHCTTILILLTVISAAAHGEPPTGSQDSPGAVQARQDPYLDPRQLTALEFGSHSHWLQPWRAYQETIPAQQFLAAQGIVLDGSGNENPELIVRMLAEHGIRNARIEIGWGFVNFFDESQLNFADRFKAELAACKRHGVRPLIPLSAHSGVPTPLNRVERTLAREAKQGDREVTLDSMNDFKAGYSGLADLTEYRAGEVLFTAIDGQTAKLSKPLPKDLGKAGTKISVTTLRYRPFSAPATPDYRETMAGWNRYVGTVARFVTDALGTQQAADRGFDLEIWNELTFGSSFLSINNYYQPKLLDYNEESIYRDLVRETADYAMQHPDDFRGVTLVDGFRNTIPWPAASLEPGRVGAMSAHPYPPRKTFPADEPAGPLINALFAKEEKPSFRPNYVALFPEYSATGLQSETVIRDMGPLTTPIYDTPHGRDSRAFAGRVLACPLWMTEMGLHPAENGVTDRDAALRLKARTTARLACFFPGKGVRRLFYFSALNGDTGFGLVQDNFAEYARTHDQYPDDFKPFVSPALATLGRIVEQMKTDLDPNLAETRPLTVESIADRHDHWQFQGDGTPQHPTLYNRDVLALLPVQVNRRRFVIPYYVMTRDVTKELPPEEYTVKLRGLDGRGATATAYDPLNDRPVAAKVESAAADGLTVTLAATDYPYLLILQESAAADGPANSPPYVQAAPQRESDSPPPSPGLSPAVIAIGFGVIVGLLVAVVALLSIRRRTRA